LNYTRAEIGDFRLPIADLQVAKARPGKMVSGRSCPAMIMRELLGPDHDWRADVSSAVELARFPIGHSDAAMGSGHAR